MIGQPPPSRLLLPVVVMTALSLALISGVIAASGSMFLMAGLLAIVGGTAITLLPVTYTFWLMLVVTFLVAGNLQYFLNVPLSNWMSYILIGALSAQWAGMLVTGRTAMPGLRAGGALVGLFILFAIFSSLLAKVPVFELLIASKNYVIIFAVPLLFASAVLAHGTLERVWLFLVAVTAIQLPFALYQYLFVASRRATSISSTGVSWDSVVGTFGGNADGGGASHPMAFLVMLAVPTAFALYRAGRLHRAAVFLVLLAGLATVLLAEVKAFFLFLPLLLGLYFSRELFRRPLLAIGLALGSFGLLYAGPMAYEVLHYSHGSSVRVTQQMSEGLMDKIENQLNPELPTHGRLVLTRAAQVALWWDVNVRRGDATHALFGYGMGATHLGRFEAGEIARRFPYRMDETGLGALLWEVGLAGTFLFCAILVWNGKRALALARHPDIPDLHRSLLRLSGAGLFICLPMLAYQSFLVVHFTGQVMLMLLLAQVAYWGGAAVTRIGDGVRLMDKPAVLAMGVR